MDLFTYLREQNREKESPLASRMRPRTLDEVAGQDHIIGKGKMLYRAIMADRLTSVIFYGPPGTGKTTLAQVIANTTSAAFRAINATTSGKKDMEVVVKEAEDRLGQEGRKTILFIDEIHRFNKGQQDYLLPYVENGTIVLVGATTENPYFEVNDALLSRSLVFELKPLTKEEIRTILKRALTDKERGLGIYHAVLEPEAEDLLCDVANGDARKALNALELAVLTTEPDEDGSIRVTLEIASDCIQKRALHYDREGDNHYDTVSAFIKSMRGSDPDAAVYYLSRMLYAGEDVRFIARRIMILAAEDIGLADPQALVIANAAAGAVDRVGMPEARIILSEAVLYMALAPKSNAAYMAVDDASREVRSTFTDQIPNHLKDAHYKGAEKLGHGKGYLYPHDFPGHFVKQDYLPRSLRGRVFYHPGEKGFEKEASDRLNKLKKDSS